MNRNVKIGTLNTAVRPLRKQQEDGRQYSRPKEIETILAALMRLSTPELVKRVRIEVSTDPCYVPSECVLYFVRGCTVSESDETLSALFKVLRQRVLRAVPVLERNKPGSLNKAVNAVDLEIREAVLHKFQEMLCQDRKEYKEQLDFFECRFNSALAMLRATARRGVRRTASLHERLEYVSEPNEHTAAVESALAAMRPSSDGTETDFLFRSKLLAAISSLPPDERRVVELYLAEIPIDSQEPDATTMVKILGCTEKTVRNRRDRAFATLRDDLKEEDA